jgi:holo-[acyl-carrier protein] synthase
VIVGVGIDVCDVARFESSLRRTPGLAARLFTDAERGAGAGRPAASLAARFAAKEALAKALGAPAGLGWHDAEVVSEGSGRPRLVLRGSVEQVATAQGVGRVHVSLTHDAGVASAVVVLEAGAAGDAAAGGAGQ